MIKIRTDEQTSDVEGGWFHARWHYSFDPVGELIECEVDL